MSIFPLFSASVPMIGRTRIFDRMCGDLTKPTPQHLSLVGPRYFGKSVMLEAVAKRMSAEGKFECILIWDLGHQTPQSDSEFLTSLRQRIAAGLKEKQPQFADYLTQAESSYDELREVIESLGKNGQRILMFWDGFDRPLQSGNLTRNLWDNMLELCRQKGFVLVTGTRRKLQELIRDEKSVTSEFWQVFEVVKLGPLEDSDIQALVVSIERTEFQPSGLAELANWTGRIPVLVLWLLNRLQHEIPTGVVTNEHVNAAATKLDEQATGLVERIWADVPVPAADLFHHLTEVKECLFATAGKAERSLLGEMGLARQIDNKLQLSCRLMAHHVSESAPSTGLVGKLFGTWESYQANIRGILERRFAQLPCFDATLFHMVAQGIGDIPAYPDVCLNNLTHIEERALDLIWERELGPDRKLTQEVVNYWAENPKSGNRFVREMMDSDQWEVKAERGKQLALLQLLTGSHQDFTRAMAKHTSKDTYVLLNAIHSFRNRNQHSGGQQIHVGVAVSAIMLCIELLGCLARTAPKKA